MARMDQLVAAQAAARALNDLEIDQSRPVDPFEAIDTLGLELQFRPLQDLLGAILPGKRPGVLINSARPASVQRYTAAHEIGHWYMDQDELAVDTQEEVEGTPRQQRERRAQVFASHFLMPLELLYTTATRHGVTKGGPLAPVQAYEMARDMHVSYRAVVLQLVNSNFINARLRDELLRVPPAQLKMALTNGRKPANTRGDVWTTDASRPGEVPLEVFVGDEVVIALPERPSTGYRWMEASNQSRPQEVRAAPARFGGHRSTVWGHSGRDNVIPLRPTDITEPILSKFADSVDSTTPEHTPSRVGSPVTRRMGFSATRPGTSSLAIDYVRPFSTSEPVDRVRLNARIRAFPDVEERHRRLRAFAREEQELGESR